jgi:NAD(P)-dependent dehydrogenase (short-subunit alcohol dehydrogenase family)
MGVLDGQAVIVTGAGRGLGRAYALDAAREGASVVVNDVDEVGARSVAEEIEAKGGRAAMVAASVSDWSGAESVVGRCRDQFGRVDGLVNNAGVVEMAAPWDVHELDARRMVEVNLLGSIFIGTHAIRVMKEQGSGSIVNATSSAQLGMPNLGVYGSTKGALASLSYSWAVDLEPHGIRVNAFSPVADTQMSWKADIPPGKLPSPEENAPAVTFLLSDLADGVTGQVLQRRLPDSLVIMSHPAHTEHAAVIEEATAPGVAAALGPMLRAHGQPLGWRVGQS